MLVGLIAAMLLVGYLQNHDSQNHDNSNDPGLKSGAVFEFTVRTPGEDDRGPRRLVIGREGEIYYTSDHYASFKQVERSR